MSGRSTILLAEDDPNDVFLICRALDKAIPDHKLVHVPDGQKCIDYLAGNSPYADRQQFPFPNLLLLDLKMPLISGFEVLTWISDHPQIKALPVIILTGSIRADDAQKAALGGATEYYIKPVDHNDLIKIMQALDARCLTRP
jgi:CheY-like chemotaxis protein